MVVRELPAIATEIRAVMAMDNPTPADWQALRAKVTRAYPDIGRIVVRRAREYAPRSPTQAQLKALRKTTRKTTRKARANFRVRFSYVIAGGQKEVGKATRDHRSRPQYNNSRNLPATYWKDGKPAGWEVKSCHF